MIRTNGSARLLRVAEAIREGGVRCIAIMMTTPGALRAIEDTAGKLGEVLMGVGTVLDALTARQAILAGAEFLVTPTVELEVIEMAHRYGGVVIPDAMTPTEILTTWAAGADMVKVFPASVLESDYVKALRGPLPQIPFMPTGGITDKNTGSFIRVGVTMMYAGGWLVDKKAVSEGAIRCSQNEHTCS